MNRLDQSSASADPIDGLMEAYFRAEMPHPWPAHGNRGTTILPPKPASRPTASWAASGRFALALSVALLLGGAWMLGGMGGPIGSSGDIETIGGSASKKTVLPKKAKDKLPPLTEDELDKLINSGNK